MNGEKIVGCLSRDGIAAEGCSSMGAGSMGGENYCGNLLWQSCLTLLGPGSGSRADKNVKEIFARVKVVYR